METFISLCVERLLSQHSQPDEFLLVLPSKRAKRYFYEEFVRAYKRPIFLPEILTIDEFLNRDEEAVCIDKTRQLFLLYDIALRIPVFESLSFEAFLAWGPLVLNDFEEINRYLLDAEKVFQNLISIKELDSWNLEDGKELSESQKQFMVFWELLPKLYEEYVAELALRGFTTGGFLLRKRASNPETFFGKKQVYFIGFNALTRAEQKIIKAFLQAEKGDYWIDVDSFYVDNPIHEAGMFHRINAESFRVKNESFVLNELLKKELEIEVIACPQVSGQVKVAASKLSTLASEELESTLVLLADERLIMPLLKNIPAAVGQANVTVGLPLSQTPLKSFVDLVFAIQENKERFKSQSVYYKDLLSVFQHPFISAWISKETREKITLWELQTVKNNRVFQTQQHLVFDPVLDSILQILFTNWGNNYALTIACLEKLTAILIEALGNENEFETQILVVFQKGLVALKNLANEGLPAMNLRTYKLFFTQHWSSLSLAYHGNPTQGLQIMGLLETRLLDFKNLLVLGLNEGVLPTNNTLDSIIPMDLRRGLGLPTPREKQGLFAHHFYRLLHRAEQALFTYSVGGDGMGLSEPSRYITQIEMELKRANPKITLVKKIYTTPLALSEDYRSLSIEKRPEISHLLENYFSKTVSVSAMLKYLHCPLDFYFRYLAELGEEEAVEEDLEMSSMGKIIHSTLEELYLPFVERDKNNAPMVPSPPPITGADVQNLITKAPEELRKQFKAYLDNDETLLSFGKNYLSYKVALEFVFNLLNHDKAYIDSVPGDVYIHRLEACLKASMEVEVNGERKTINWLGFIDRIDRVQNEYRLVDYKSGKVKIENVEYSRKENVRKSFMNCKHALQLAVYAYLFERNYGFFPSEKGIYAIQKNRDAFFPLLLKEVSEEEFMEDFRQIIQELLTEIYNVEIPFEHAETARYCSYC